MASNFLRMKNIFGPSDSFNRAMTPPSMPSRQPMEPRIDENINVEVEDNSPALTRLYDALENMPQRGKVGTRGKIGSILMALGGRSPENIDQTVYSKYHQGMDDFNARIDPLLKAGKLEADTLNNQSLADYRMGQVDNSRVRAQTGQTNAVTSQQRAGELQRHNKSMEDVARLKLQQPDLQFDAKGPTVLIYDKKTGQVTDTGIDTTNMTDAEKLSVGQRNALERIDRSNQGAMDRKLTPSPGTDKPLLPTQAKQELLNNYQRMKLERPDLADLVEFDNEENLTIKGPSDGIFGFGATAGPSDAQKKEIMDFLGRTTGLPPLVPPADRGTGAGNTVNQTPLGGPNPSPAPQTDKRTRAINALTKQGRLVNEQTIAAAMARMK